MRWNEENEATGGVRARRFAVDSAGRRVPGVLWTPSDADDQAPIPLVLVGHGAAAHKQADQPTWVAQRLVHRHGIAAMAIDGPVHGERRTDGSLDRETVSADFQVEWAREEGVDDMLLDWRAAIDGVRGLPQFADGPLGYWGLSMGSIYGIPLLASDASVRAAAIGLIGATAPTEVRLMADAPSVAASVWFVAQRDDQVFPFEDALRLFDALGTQDKRLRLALGPHAGSPIDELEQSVDFLAARLSAPLVAAN